MKRPVLNSIGARSAAVAVAISAIAMVLILCVIWFAMNDFLRTSASGVLEADLNEAAEEAFEGDHKEAVENVDSSLVQIVAAGGEVLACSPRLRNLSSMAGITARTSECGIEELAAYASAASPWLEEGTPYLLAEREVVGADETVTIVGLTSLRAGLETIAATKVVNNNAKLYANLAEGFVGIGMKNAEGAEFIADCSDLSEIIVIGKDGKYRVTKVSDKAFFGKDLLYAGVFHRNDARTIYNVIYRDGKGPAHYAKRFAITSISRDKEYDITTGAEGSRIYWFTVNHNGEAETVRVSLRPKKGLKKSSLEYDFSALAIKGRTSRGNLVTKNPIQKVQLKAKGVTTLGGKDIWYDADIQRLNEDGRGDYVGEFTGNDRVLAIFADGTFYTTTYDLVNKYQGDVVRIEKLDPGRTYTVLYWDNAVKAFYIKRFSFVESNNTPMLFISDAKGSKLIDISSDLHPQVRLTFGGRQEGREAEVLDAEEFIAKKGITAKGKKCSSLDLAAVEFIEPIHKPEDDVVPEEEEPIEIELDDDIPEIPEAPAAMAGGGEAADLLKKEDPEEPADFTDWTLF